MAFKTAAEMREITEETFMSDIKDIIKQMEVRARQGKYEYGFEGLLTPIQKETFKELGYLIRTGTQYNQPWVIISW